MPVRQFGKSRDSVVYNKATIRHNVPVRCMSVPPLLLHACMHRDRHLEPRQLDDSAEMREALGWMTARPLLFSGPISPHHRSCLRAIAEANKPAWQEPFLTNASTPVRASCPQNHDADQGGTRQKSS